MTAAELDVADGGSDDAPPNAPTGDPSALESERGAIPAAVPAALGRAAPWALAAHALIAGGLLISDGHDQPVAVVMVMASVVTLALALRLAPSAEGSSVVAPVTWTVAWASVLSAFVRSPGKFLSDEVSRRPYTLMSLAAALVVLSYIPEVASGARRPSWVARARPAAMLGLALGLGAWIFHASPAPGIDVWTVHQQGADALLHGRPLYAYGAVHTVDSHSFARPIATYAYPPANALLTTLGYLATGDTRWSALAAFLVGAWLLWKIARRSVGPGSVVPDLLLACLLFHPRALFVLEEAWGEPLSLPFLAGFVLAALSGRPKTAAVLLGLLCAMKQHFVLYVPALALVPGIGLRGAVLAGATAGVTFLPFVLTGPHDLYMALVGYIAKDAFRGDSMSFTAMLSDAGIFLPSWVGLAAGLLSFVALLRVPRRVGPLLLSSAFTFLSFYVFGRQAFCNYYFFLGATLLVAVAALTRPSSAPRCTPAGGTSG
jgi:hypothetical protein